MQDCLMQKMLKTGHLSGSNAAYVEELYELYLVDEEGISSEWRAFFKSLESSTGKVEVDISHSRIRRDFEALGRQSRYKQVLSNDAIVNSEHESKQVQVLQLISSYRVRGHQKSNLDPLGIMRRDRVPDLELEFHDLFPIDSSTIFQTGSLFITKQKAPLREIVEIAPVKSKVAAKYANPEDPSQTWTGRGRKPRWVEAFIQKGNTLKDLEI